jgi:glycine oxidase
VLVHRDHRVNNRLLAQALTVAATRAGVIIRTGTPATAVENAGGQVSGVRLSSGERIAARHVVIAAGSWSGELDGLPQSLPVFPVKGQMLAVDGRARSNGRGTPAPIARVVHGTGAYLIPREDGRVLIGATVEHVGYRKGPTPRGVASLIAAAARMVPLLADLPMVETWAGFRPGTPDDMPIIGGDPLLEGLYYATGHFRNGILLAPLSARVIAELITSTATPAIIEPFGIVRFR